MSRPVLSTTAHRYLADLPQQRQKPRRQRKQNILHYFTGSKPLFKMKGWFYERFLCSQPSRSLRLAECGKSPPARLSCLVKDAASFTQIPSMHTSGMLVCFCLCYMCVLFGALDITAMISLPRNITTSQNAFALPIVVAFEPAQPSGWVAFDYIVDAIFVADLIKNFRTAYFNASNVLVQDTARISRRYIHSWFAVDLIASIPFELFAAAATGASVLGRSGDSSQVSLRLVSALKSIRLLRLGRFAKIADRWKFGNLWSIVRQYVGIVLLAHWLACIWFLVSNSYENGGGDNWLVVQGLDIASSREQYISCMLAAVLMLFRTLGNPPVTVEEKLFLLIAVLLGAAVHATIFGQVAHLVSQLSSKEGIYRHRMRQLYERMRYYDLPPALQERVTVYFETLWKRHRIVDTKDMLAFTGSLSEPLQLQVNLFLNREMVQRVPMFQNCHASVIVQVVQSLRSHFFIPGDYVVRAGEMGSHMFFIRDGTCQVLVARAKSAQQLAAEAAAADEAALLRLSEAARGAWPRLRQQLAQCNSLCVPKGGLAGCFGPPPAEHTDAAAGQAPGMGSPTEAEAAGANPLQEGAAGQVPILPSQSPDEELMVVKSLHPGDFFGEVSLLFRVKRTATICSTAYSDLASLDAASFESILETNPDFAAKLEEGFQKYLALNQGANSADSDGSEGNSATGGAKAAQVGVGDSKNGVHRGGGAGLGIMSRGASNNTMLQPAAALTVASQMFGHAAVPLPEQGGAPPPHKAPPLAKEADAGEPRTPLQSSGSSSTSSGASSDTDSDADRPSSLQAVQLQETSPEHPPHAHAPPPVTVPRRLSSASAGAPLGITPLPPSPTNRARRQMQAAIAASDPQHLWTAKVTQSDMADSGSPQPSHSLQLPPHPGHSPMPRAISLGSTRDEQQASKPGGSAAFLQAVKAEAAQQQRRRHSAVHDIRGRGMDHRHRSKDTGHSWSSSGVPSRGAGLAAGAALVASPARSHGVQASPELLGSLTAHVQTAAATACSQGVSAMLQQQEAFMARLPGQLPTCTTQPPLGEAGTPPPHPGLQAALDEVRAQQSFILQSFSQVMGQLEALSAGLHARLAAVEDAVLARREGETSPDPRRSRSSSVFHKSAVVV